MGKKIILIDLDGVLNKYEGEYNKENIPEIKEGAKEFLHILSDKFIIKIFSTREKTNVARWVEQNKIGKYISGITNRKEPAYLILDDRCVVFKGDYKKALYDIENFKVWYK